MIVNYKCLPFVEKIYSSLCTFIDQSKAFDSVRHTLLLESLKDIGIRVMNLDLFNNYLSERSQIVRINGEMDEDRQLRCGIPQATVLCPILFNIYFNHLFSLPSSGIITSFTDDTVIFYRESDWEWLKNPYRTRFYGNKKLARP